MQAIELAFYFFSSIIVLSGALVVLSRNPVHSVLWLISTFFGTSGLFILLEAEYLALILMIVYVGAVAVLFMFVVMMLNINFSELKSGFTRYLPAGLLIGLVLLVELGLVFGDWRVLDADQVSLKLVEQSKEENTRQIGLVLYTDYIIYFQMAGLILLIAMIGAIILTHRKRKDVKRQNVLEQIYRDPKSSIDLKDIKPGQGL